MLDAAGQHEALLAITRRTGWMMQALRAAPPVDALPSLEAAVASWPEYATAVGLCLDDEDRLTIIAPHGLDDLFDMVVRRNPARVSVDEYRRRVRTKAYTRRWPLVSVIPC